MVGCTPALLGKVNVKSLKHLCIVVICGTQHLDGVDAVYEGMEFRDVEMFSDARGHKKALVVMEHLESCRHVVEGEVIMRTVLCEVNEVQESAAGHDAPLG